MRCLEKKPENRFATAKELYNYAKESMAKSDRAEYLETSNNSLNVEVDELKSKLTDAEKRIKELRSLSDSSSGHQGHDSVAKMNILEKENNLLNNEIKKLAKRNLTTVIVSALLLFATLATFILI